MRPRLASVSLAAALATVAACGGGSTEAAGPQAAAGTNPPATAAPTTTATTAPVTTAPSTTVATTSTTVRSGDQGGGDQGHHVMGELPDETCPDDMGTFDNGLVQYQGQTVTVRQETWSWAEHNCRNLDQGGSAGSGAPNGSNMKGGQHGSSIATSGPGAERPVLSGLPVDFAAVRYGERLDEKMMMQGPIVSSGTAFVEHAAEPSIVLQFLTPGTEVRSVSSGTVLDVTEQSDTCDSEIHVVNVGAGGDAAWVVSYDHVRNVTVAAGATIEPGTVLGNVGSMFMGCDAGTGRVELQVNRRTAPETAVCPLSLMAPPDADTARAAIRAVMDAWNAKHAGTYADDVLAGGGCVAEETTP